MNAEQIQALDAKLASQIGDDVSAIYDHESLFKQARWASRHTLTPETVRVCRVHDVTEDEAFAAGFQSAKFAVPRAGLRETIGPGAWDRNDWVMVALCKIGGVE